MDDKVVNQRKNSILKLKLQMSTRTLDGKSKLSDLSP